MTKIVKTITATCDFIDAVITDGYVSLGLDQEDLDEFNSMSEKEKIQHLEEYGTFNIAVYSMNGWEIS